MTGAARLCETYDVALLDLDGVVYLGAEAIPAVPVAVAGRGDMRFSYVTNNATRTPEAVWAQLAAIGCPGSAADVVTSCAAAAELVAAAVPVGSRVLVLGADALRAAISAVGMVCVRRSDEEPVAVVQGLSLEMVYADFAEAALAIGAGATWIATNTDATLPTARGLLPGNGSMVAAMTTATGRRPLVAGKPEPHLFRTAAQRAGAARPLVVGDRLDTDIAGAVRAEFDSLLVFTGVSQPRDVLLCEPGLRPTYLAADLSGLTEIPAVAAEAYGRWTCGGWTATIAEAGATLSGAGTPLDALRALSAVTQSMASVTAADAEAAAALAALGIAAPESAPTDTV